MICVKKNKKKGYAAPIVITVIFVLYVVFYFGVLASLLPNVMAGVFLIVTIAIAGVLIYVCVERIKEIRSGIEDDLGKY